MKVVREYTLFIHTHRELTDDELRQVERCVDDELEGEEVHSYSTFDTDEAKLVDQDNVGVGFGVDVQKKLRVAARKALKEIDETHGNDLPEEVIEPIREFRRNLPKPGADWNFTCLDTLYSYLCVASEAMGDHALWNEGGQGYKASKLVREALE